MQSSFLLHACSGTMTRRKHHLRCIVRSFSALSDHSHQYRGLGHLDGVVYITVHFTWASVWHSAPHFMCATTGSIFFLGKCLSAHLYKSVAGIYQSYCVALRSMSGFGGSISSPSSILSDTLSLPDSSEAASLTGEITVDVN